MKHTVNNFNGTLLIGLPPPPIRAALPYHYHLNMQTVFLIPYPRGLTLFRIHDKLQVLLQNGLRIFKSFITISYLTTLLEFPDVVKF